MSVRVDEQFLRPLQSLLSASTVMPKVELAPSDPDLGLPLTYDDNLQCAFFHE